MVPTFREAAKKVHEAHAATVRNRKHGAQWLASLEADVFPVFGDCPVSAIDSSDGLARVLPQHKGAAYHHAALPYRKVPAFVEQLRACDAGESTKLAFEYLILTAARTSEVLSARLSEIDLDAGVWKVPASRIKAGREHRVPLAPRANEILERAQALADGGPFVFPGRSPVVPRP